MCVCLRDCILRVYASVPKKHQVPWSWCHGLLQASAEGSLEAGVKVTVGIRRGWWDPNSYPPEDWNSSYMLSHFSNPLLHLLPLLPSSVHQLSPIINFLLVVSLILLIS